MYKYDNSKSQNFKNFYQIKKKNDKKYRYENISITDGEIFVFHYCTR